MHRFAVCLRLAGFRAGMALAVAAGFAVATLLLPGPALAQSLSEAVRAAVAHNPARQAALSGFAAQADEVDIARGLRGPRLSLTGEIGPEWVDDPASLSPEENAEWNTARAVALRLEQTLSDGGRSRTAVLRELAILDAEALRLSDETETLALAAVEAYLDVLRHRRILALREDGVALHERALARIEEQVRSGAVAEADRQTAADWLLSARLARTGAEAALADAASVYELVVGRAPGAALTRPPPLPPPPGRETVVKAAVAGSPQVALAANEIARLRYEATMSESGWKPRVDLFASAGASADRNGTRGDRADAAVGLRLNWTLYQGGARQATVARNRDLALQAEHRKRQAEEAARDVARRAWAGYEAAAERRRLIDRSVVVGETLLRLTTEEYEAAKRPLLSVLAAEADLLEAQVRKVTADAAEEYQKHKLLAVMHRLSAHFGIAPPAEGPPPGPGAAPAAGTSPGLD